MEHALPEDRRENGGFPDPPAADPVRIVVARHTGCGTRTRVRLPDAVPAGVVRRLRCSECEAAFEVADRADVADLGVERPASGRSRAGARLPGPLWRWASLPLGAAAVVGALLLIQGGGEPPAVPAGGAVPGEAAAATAPVAAPASAARLVRESSYALALPAGWRRDRDAPGGASFAAAARDGGADATLWVERAPGLDLASFERRSLDQLRSLAGSAQVVDRVAAPTPEATIIRLAADAPPGEPRFEVTLRAAGPLRFYLATTIQPDASRAAGDGAELIHGSFTPAVERR